MTGVVGEAALREVRILIEEFLATVVFDLKIMNSANTCQKIGKRRCTHAEGVRHAGIFSYAPVSDTRRQIEYIAAICSYRTVI